MGLYSCFALERAALPHGYQSTGLSACCLDTDYFPRQGDCAAFHRSASVQVRAILTSSRSGCPNLPRPEGRAQLPALRLKRNEDRRLRAGHLWVFSNEVDTLQTPLSKFKAGELVRVLAHNDQSLGVAYVNPQSLIRPEG